MFESKNFIWVLIFSFICSIAIVLGAVNSMCPYTDKNITYKCYPVSVSVSESSFSDLTVNFVKFNKRKILTVKYDLAKKAENIITQENMGKPRDYMYFKLSQRSIDEINGVQNTKYTVYSIVSIVFTFITIILFVWILIHMS